MTYIRPIQVKDRITLIKTIPMRTILQFSFSLSKYTVA